MRDEDKSKEQLIAELAEARRLVAAADAAADGTFQWDISSNRVELDDRLHALLGTTPGSFGSGPGPVGAGEFIRRVHQSDVAGLMAALSSHLERGVPLDTEFRIRQGDGSYLWVACKGNVQRADDDTPLRLTGTIASVGERKSQELALRHNEGLYRSLFLYLPEPAVILSPAGEFVESNLAASTLLGYSRDELLQRGLLGILAPGQVTAGIALLGHLADIGIHEGGLTLSKSDGAGLRAQLRGARLSEDAYLCLIQASVPTDPGADVPKSGYARDEVMNSTMRLAGGLAHEFNNILTPVMGYAQLGARSMHADERALGYLREIQRAAERASAVTRQLLAFSRNQLINPKVVNVGDLVSGMEPTLQDVVGENVGLVVRKAPDTGEADLDVTEMERVLVALARNAREAMPAGGTLTVSTSNLSMGTDEAEAHAGMGAGEYVLLSVSDTGTGMEEDVLRRAMEPLYTTKEPGQGLGLGLSTVYGVVSQHGGHMELRSRPGQGTSVLVYLPRRRESDFAALNGSSGVQVSEAD